MTLALYGKSRKRQGSLLLAAFLAIIAASVGGLAIISSAFAHHLVLTTQLPTCQNNSAWNLVVSEGSWSGYREAVLTVTDPTTPVALRFSPYIDNGTGSTTILSANGTGAVHTAGHVDQYLGSFGNDAQITNDDIGGSNVGINNSTTVLTKTTDWPAAYAAGGVIKIDNELMKIVSVNNAAAGNPLTVTRGFGDSAAAQHSGSSAPTAQVWTRGAFDSSASPGTVTWNMQAEAPNCVAKIITKKVVTGTGADASQNFTANIVNTDDNSGEVNGLVFSQTAPDTRTWNEDDTTDDFEVNEVSIPANWTVTGTFIAEGDVACPSPTAGTWDTSTPSNAAGGALNNIANGDVVTVCFRNNYTAPATPVVTVTKADSGDGTYNLGESFNWVINVAVSGAVTTSSKIIWDDMPSQFTVNSVTVNDPYNNPDKLTCNNADPVDCTLASGAAIGANYTITVNVTVSAAAACAPVTNTVYDAKSTAGNVLATDSVTISGCGDVSIAKTYASEDAPNYYWTITLTNTSSVAKNVYVYDANSSLANETCTGSVTESPADYYNCTVPANGVATLTLTTTIPVHANLCAPQTDNNVAYLLNNNAAGAPPTAYIASSSASHIQPAGQSASCVNIDKANATKVGNTLQWVVTLTNTSSVAQTVAVFDANSSLVSETCSNTVSENPADTYSCEVPANSSATITLSTPYGGSGSVCDGYQTSNTAFINGQQNKSDTAQYSDTAQGGASCITVTKVKTATSNPPTWTVSIVNTASIAQSVYVQDTDATLAQVVSGGSCTGGDTIMGNGVQCTVNANSTLILTVTKAYPPAATCEGTDVSNTVNVWVGTFASTPQTAPDKTADGGTFDNLNANPALCSHTVKVCKIVVGNGDGIVDGGQFRFGSNPSNASATINSQTTEPALDAVDGAQGTKNCVDLIVANTDTTIFEWGYRPGDGQGLTGTWNGDASGFPKSTSGASDSCGTLPSNGTVSINSQTTEVTFCNKTVSRTKEIQVVKIFQNANGSALAPTYVATAADLPTFTMTPNPWTGTGSYVIVDDANCDLQNPNPNVFGWYCSIPAAANPTVTETPKAGWIQSFNGECTLTGAEGALVKAVEGLVSEVLGVVIQDATPYARWTFCNYPVGKIIVQKNDNTSNTNTGRPAQWNFEVDGSQTYQGNVALGGGQWVTENVPFGSYSADETNGHFDPSICPTSGNPNGNGYTSTDLTPGSQSITQPGQTITFVFRNDDCGRVLGTGSLHVFKIRDINGNGQTDGGDTQIVWTVTIQGPEFPAGQVFNVPAAGLHLNGITEGVYTITEASQFGYILVGVASTENPGLVVSTSTSVTVKDNEQDTTVIFYNQPSGQIPVHKNAFTSHNGGANVAAPNDDDGWTITLTSAQCGINQVKVTDANGDALFTGLPLCNDYVVSEGAVNASSPGFVPLTAAQFTNITPNGVTLTFNNILRTQDPPCINCGPTTTPTPVTPTATPPTTTVVPPTNTPVPPTATPTLTGIVGGERTPGPGQPTPIAPSTGGGVLGGTAGGFNLLLILAGLLALTSGVSFLALGRKNRR